MALAHHRIESTRAALILLHEAEERVGVVAAGTWWGDEEGLERVARSGSGWQ